MPIYSNEGGVLYELDNVYSNDGGTLYDLDTVHSNEGGVLYEIFSASSPTHVKWTANTSADSDAKIVSTTPMGFLWFSQQTRTFTVSTQEKTTVYLSFQSRSILCTARLLV